MGSTQRSAGAVTRGARVIAMVTGAACLLLALAGCVQTSSDPGGFQNEPGPIGIRTPQTFGSGK